MCSFCSGKAFGKEWDVLILTHCFNAIKYAKAGQP